MWKGFAHGSVMRKDTQNGILPMVVALALLVFVWCLEFAPVLFQHQNLLGYRLLNARITGIEASNERRGVMSKLPSQDASMLQTHFPFQFFLAQQFHRGTFPLWNPLAGCGAPVTSDPQFKPWNPFFWPFFAWPSAWMFSLCIAAMALAGLGGFLVFFRRTGLGWVASTSGAMLAVFNPMVHQTIVLSSPWGAWLVPWGFWGAEAWHQGRRWGLPVVAMVTGLAVYAGHPTIALLYTALLFLYLEFMSSERGPTDRLKAGLMVAGAVGLMTAVHTFPLAANLSQYWTYKSNWDGGPYQAWASLVNPKSEIYVPMPIWGLAFVGLVRGARRLRLFFFAAMVYGVLVMFPWVGPGILRTVLTFGGVLVARYGQEAFWLGLAGLAAMGVQGLFAAAREERKRDLLPLRLFIYGVVWYWGLTWISVMSGGLFWPAVFRRVPLAHQIIVWEAATVLFLSIGALLPRWRMGLACLLLGCAILAILPMRLPLAMQRYYSTTDLAKTPPPVLAPALTGQEKGPALRLSGTCFAIDTPAVLAPNQSLCWNVPDIRATNPLLLKNYKRFSDHWNAKGWFGGFAFFPEQDAEVLRFLGVRFVAAEADKPIPSFPVLKKTAPLCLQEVTGAVPWVRPVGRWEVAPDSARFWTRTFDMIETGAWRDTVLLDKVPPIAPASVVPWSAPRVDWRETGPNRWSWDVEGGMPCLLLVLQNDHPGWHAAVDGSPVQILRAYGSFMALPVPAGSHTVELVFKAPWFIAGLILTLVGWLWVAAWGITSLRTGFPRAGRG